MISVSQAWTLMKNDIPILKTETIALADSAGRVLRQVLVADRDYPPFNRVAMDGYALSFKQWQSGRLTFAVQETQTAGQAPTRLQNDENCIEIMTGAKLPEGCDLVIRYEDTERRGPHAVIQAGLQLERFTNVHRQGIDCPKGTAYSDRVLSPPLAALAASFGLSSLEVSRKARISIIGTGDELVPITSQPKDFQIRASNIHAVKMAVESHGHEVIYCRTLPDDRETIFASVKKALESSDIVLLSGGVSAGKTDFIPAVLADCGVAKIFHKIAQKPGKPLWFGRTQAGQSVFGLPGNPVSTLICFYRYVLPYLREMEGRGNESLPVQPTVTLISERPKLSRLTHFVPVRLEFGSDAKVRAIGNPHNGSGDFVSLSSTDGFVEIPGEDEPDYDPNQTLFSFYSW